MIMKKCGIVSLIFSLIVSLAAPAGVVFAMDEETDSTDGELLLLKTEDIHVGDIVQSNEEASDEPLVEKENVNNEAVSPQPNRELIATSDHPEEAAVYASGIVITEVRTQYASAYEEFIELYNDSDEDVNVLGWCVNYVSTAQKSVCLQSKEAGIVGLVLPARSYIVLVSNSFAVNNPTFGYDFAFPYGLSNGSGSVVLVNNLGEEVDSVQWGVSSVDVSPHSKGLALRRVQNAQGAYIDSDNSANDFSEAEPRELYEYGSLIEMVDMCVNIEDYQSMIPEGYLRHEGTGDCVDMSLPVRTCEGIVISELAANVTDQFIELYNQTNESLDISGCLLQTNRGNATYALPDVVLAAGAYEPVYIVDTDLTLTKTTSGTVYLLSSDGKLEADSSMYSNLAKETSWALVDGVWKQTYEITAGKANRYVKYPACDEGYWRNEETGRCNKIAEPAVLADCGEGRERNPATGRCRNIATGSTLAPCKEGQYRSEETNRCRSIASAAASVLKPCADDQFRNPETNRCKKIASVDELVDCGEGRERNPETNRCRNVLSAAMPVAGFAPEIVTETATGMMGWWVAGGVSLAAVSYGVWQWRFEISRLTKKTAAYFTSRGK